MRAAGVVDRRTNQRQLCCRYSFSCSSAIQRALLLRLLQVAAAEQEHMAEHNPSAAVLLQPWRNVAFNGGHIMPQLLTDLRRLAIPRSGTVTLDYVSHVVRYCLRRPIVPVAAARRAVCCAAPVVASSVAGLCTTRHNMRCDVRDGGSGGRGRR